MTNTYQVRERSGDFSGIRQQRGWAAFVSYQLFGMSVVWYLSLGDVTVVK